MKLITVKSLIIFMLVSSSYAYASEYKPMSCRHYPSGEKFVATYDEGVFYDSIDIIYVNSGETYTRQCIDKDLGDKYGATEYKNIKFKSAHYKKCSIDNGVYYSESYRKSDAGHVLGVLGKFNFVSKEAYYGRWICQPGQEKDCSYLMNIIYECSSQ